MSYHWIKVVRDSVACEENDVSGQHLRDTEKKRGIDMQAHIPLPAGEVAQLGIESVNWSESSECVPHVPVCRDIVASQCRLSHLCFPIDSLSQKRRRMSPPMKMMADDGNDSS